MSKEYKVGDKLNFVGGVKIQITGVNSDGTANFSEINPATKKPYPFNKGMHGKLPSLAQQGKEQIKLTSFVEEDISADGSVSVDEYIISTEGEKIIDDSVFTFVNLSGFKKFLQNNVGKVVLTLTESDEVTIVGNTGNTVVKHKFLNVPRIVDKVNSQGFSLEGSFVDWGKADEWSFHKDLAVWKSSTNDMHLVYKIQL